MRPILRVQRSSCEIIVQSFLSLFLFFFLSLFLSRFSREMKRDAENFWFMVDALVVAWWVGFKPGIEVGMKLGEYYFSQPVRTSLRCKVDAGKMIGARWSGRKSVREFIISIDLVI